MLALITELVLSLKVPDEKTVEDEREEEETHAGGVSRTEPTVDHLEEERGGDTGRVTDGEMHTSGKGTLSISRVVGRNPGEGDTGTDKDTNGNKAASGVRGGVVVLRDEHAVTDHGGDDTADDEVTTALGDIRETGTDDVDNGTDGVDRDGHGLDFSRGPGTHGADNGGEEDDKGVEHGKEREESKAVSPGGPILDTINDIRLDELSHVAGLSKLSVVDLAEVILVLVGKELGSLRAVGENKGDEEGSKNSGGTVDKNDPSPSTPTASTVKETDTIGDKTASNTRSSSSSVKVGDSQSKTSTAVKHGKVKNDTRKKPSLTKSKKETADDETSEVLNPGAESGDDAPGESKTGEVS